MSLVISLCAPTKFLPLSLWISVGHPLRLENRLNAARKAAVVKSMIISRCTVFVEKQTNNARYTLQG